MSRTAISATRSCSDEELQNYGDDDGHTREAKLQVLQQEFAQKMKKQTKKIRLDENGNHSEQLPAIFAHTIGMFAAWSALDSISLDPPPAPEREDQATEPLQPLQLDERLLKQLVRLTHVNRNSKAFLINEYLEYLKTQTAAAGGADRSLTKWKVVESSTPEVAAKKTKKPKKRLCWIVASEMLQKCHLQELTLHNQWDYFLTPKVREAGGGSEEAQQHELSTPANASPVATGKPPTDTISATTTPNTTPMSRADPKSWPPCSCLCPGISRYPRPPRMH